MNNQDMPANAAGVIQRPVPRRGDPLGNYKVESNGLTKLEYAAIHIAAGLACRQGYERFGLATDAALTAKALFEELDKENG